MSSHSHSHSHSHAHGGGTEKGNFSSRFSGFAGFVVSLCSNATLYASLIDFFLKSDEDELGYSVKGLGIGLGLAILTAAGGTYCHYLLYTQNQAQPTVSEAHADYDSDNDDGGGSQMEEGGVATPFLLTTRYQHKKSLPPLQLLALLGDGAGHTGDMAGPLNLAARVLGMDSFSSAAQIGITGIIILFAVFGSAGDIRVCYRALQRENEAKTIRIKKTTQAIRLTNIDSGGAKNKRTDREQDEGKDQDQVQEL
jgi:hypothetical protein